VLVVNVSATIPAALDVVRSKGRPATLHASTDLGGGRWAVELRPPGPATGPSEDVRAGERIRLPRGARITLEAPYPDPSTPRPRLWRARVGGVDLASLLRRHGRPIAYAYVEGRWPLAHYQTVFALHPGSAEMPSAGRPFTDRLVTALAARGVVFAPLLLHTGVSSLEEGEAPYPERYRVPRATAALVNQARARGGRVIAVGTTAARALESVADPDGVAAAGEGWTDLALGADRPSRALDGLITGWHAAGASHLRLLEALAGRERVRRAYAEALRQGYLWHEFGDSLLLWR
jgi:S-adenosylmethionine:tRNA ribosyltransferase-isomerase